MRIFHQETLSERDERDDRADESPAWWSGARGLAPLPWEERATARLLRPGFRLPATDDPAPDPRTMLGVCAWAATLAVIGLAVAARAVVPILAGDTPPWYPPTIVIGGLAGILLTSAAFLTIRRTRLPWILLGAATVPLVVALTSTALAV